MRVEDLDSPRVKPGASEQAVADLDWLGLDWDGPTTTQLANLTPYQDAIRQLHDQGRIYPCACTRSEIDRAQSAPHAEDHERRYPGICRHRLGESLPGELSTGSVETPDATVDRPPAAWRLITPDQPVTFDDAFVGRQSINVQKSVGDFLIATKAGLPAYQLAVVVDDAKVGVDFVVRGDDLISSAARQLWIYQFLGLSPRPTYCHLPLVLGPDGHRLAKRHGDTRVAMYRDAGVPAERIIGLCAYWSGMIDRPLPLTIDEFMRGFSLENLPHHPMTFTVEDHAWLIDQ